MDPATESTLRSLGIEPLAVPKGVVRLLQRSDMDAMGGRISSWSSHPNNHLALAYEVETETRRHVGVVLRNLHLDRGRKSHLTEVNETEEALWHNFTPALPIIWSTGIAVLVEGPKDARILFEYAIPALAYLGQVPSPDHWEVVARYAHTVIWIPDNEVLTYKVRQRREQSHQSGKDRGLVVWEVKLPVKDAGELAGNHDELVKIQERVKQASLLRGGGYKCPGLPSTVLKS